LAHCGRNHRDSVFSTERACPPSMGLPATLAGAFFLAIDFKVASNGVRRILPPGGTFARPRGGRHLRSSLGWLWCQWRGVRYERVGPLSWAASACPPCKRGLERETTRKTPLMRWIDRLADEGSVPQQRPEGHIPIERSHPGPGYGPERVRSRT
jgi:hypothetical protein